MDISDKRYIKQCLNGHPDDFRHLVKRYQGPLLAHLAPKSGSKDKAEEAAQGVAQPGLAGHGVDPGGGGRSGRVGEVLGAAMARAS